MNKPTAYPFIFLIIFIFSCESKEENLEKSIVGTWFQESSALEDNPELSYRNELVFWENGTYERSLQIVKTENVKEIVGFRSLFTGNYQVTGDRLKRMNVEHFGLDNVNPYLNRDDLILSDSTQELPEIRLLFNKSKNELTLDYFMDRPCPPLAICIEFQTFHRDN